MFIFKRATLVTQAAAYADTELIGGKQSYEMRTPGGAGRLTRLGLKSLTSVGVNSTVFLFDSNPAATTFTENGAFTLNSADRTRLIHAVAIASGDWVNYSARTGLYVVEKALSVPFKFSGTDRDIYAAWVLGGAHTPGSVADVEVHIGAEVD